MQTFHFFHFCKFNLDLPSSTYRTSQGFLFFFVLSIHLRGGKEKDECHARRSCCFFLDGEGAEKSP